MPEDFRQVIDSIARTRGEALEVFIDFVRMAACALAMQTREEEYLEAAKRYSREELEEFSKALGLLINEMESTPFTDLLGPYYLEIGSKFSRDLKGEFYTPKEVGNVMAKVLVDAPKVIAENKPITVCDPAGGSGGLVLSLAQEFAKAKAVDLLRVTLKDISKVACDMAYINMALWGIPTHIIQGDTLRNTVIHEWRNIHWFRVGQHDRERIDQFMTLLKQPVQPAETIQESASAPPTHQQEFGFE